MGKIKKEKLKRRRGGSKLIPYAKIHTYWQVVDEKGVLIEDAHTLKDAKRIQKEYNEGKYYVEKAEKR